MLLVAGCRTIMLNVGTVSSPGYEIGKSISRRIRKMGSRFYTAGIVPFSVKSFAFNIHLHTIQGSGGKTPPALYKSLHLIDAQ